MVERLKLEGSTPEEAEPIIASKRTAFKKATKQFKKVATKTPKWNQKNSKNVSHRLSANCATSNWHPKYMSRTSRQKEIAK
jgi:hypothetical protein